MSCVRFFFFFFFFFQAEDGIRDRNVTGVQTCALPIFAHARLRQRRAPSRSGGARPAACSSGDRRDRKSTRLNSSHVSISYAVFCLKKKKNITPWDVPRQEPRSRRAG